MRIERTFPFHLVRGQKEKRKKMRKREFSYSRDIMHHKREDKHMPSLSFWLLSIIRGDREEGISLG